MGENKLFKKYLQDSAVLLGNINNVLLKLESDPENVDLIHQAFRSVHSLKSEASYLEQNEVTEIAHQMESLLDDLRNSKIAAESEVIDFLLQSSDSIKELIPSEEISSSFTESTPTQVDVREEKVKPFSNLPVFNEFEKDLLSEARERGEKFYRIICEIEESAPLKYPRAYLLVNNLELLVNVIKINPSMYEKKDDLFRVVTIFFTSSVKEAEISDAINVDQIKRIELVSLNYSSFIPIGEKSVEADKKDEISDSQILNIEVKKIDEILSYIDEFKIQVHRLKKGVSASDIENLSKLTLGIEQTVRDVRMVPLSEEFERYPRLVRDLSRKLNKDAEIVITGADIRVDRRVTALLSDPMVHLIRNAMVHGIEVPEIRIKNGKSGTGTITVNAVRKDEQLVIEVSDNGIGINRLNVIDRAKELGLETDFSLDDDKEMLKLLSTPGFSIDKEATDFSGRGVGLDLVSKRIEQFSESSLVMSSVTGEGSRFIITIPGGYSLMQILFARYGNKTIAIPARNVERTVQTKDFSYSHDRGGALWFDKLPVFSINGRLFISDAVPDEAFAVIFHHLGKKAVLLVDELLFEQDFPEEQLTLYIEDSPHLYRVSIGGRDTDFHYLSPSIIS